MPPNIVIVAGGGLFADQVRVIQKKWQLNNVTSHEMAILAMQQMALLFQGLQPRFKCIESIDNMKPQTTECPIIWLPQIQELNQAGIAANWNITSDSLAAWLATKIQADQLTLIKSTQVADNSSSSKKWFDTDIVDTEFYAFTKKAKFNIRIMSVGKFCNDETLKLKALQ